MKIFSCASTMIHEQYDADDRIQRASNDEKSDNEMGDDSDILLPPGRKLLLTRKRSMSFHKSAEDIEPHDTLSFFIDPYNPKFAPRSRSQTEPADMYEWKDFDMDRSEVITNLPRSDSGETDSSGSTPERRNSNDPISQLRETFTSLDKKRSKSLTKLLKKEPKLSPFDENDSGDI